MSRRRKDMDESKRVGRSIMDTLGGRRLGNIVQDDIQDIVDLMLSWELDPSTVRNTVNALRPIFRRAVKRKVIFVNPTRDLELPAAKGKRMRVADPAELASLLAALPTEESQALWGRQPWPACDSASSKHYGGNASTLRPG